jgi:heavy metal translocating P-type ATPase
METQRGCQYCGLPLPHPPSGDGRPEYCCFGCRFAAAVAEGGGEEGLARWTLARLGSAIFFTMNVMVFSMALWTQDVYGESSGELAGSLHELWRWGGLLFSAPVLLLLGGPLLDSAITDLRRGAISADLLLLSGIFAAFLLSLRSVLAGAGHVYFEVVCVVLVAVTLGRWLEATGKLKTTQALRSLDKLLPATVRRVATASPSCLLAPRQDPTERTLVECFASQALAPLATTAESETSLAEVAIGDVVRVLPGERIPVDGVIRRNHAAIDEQIVTGESQPAIKEPGDRVLAGTLNLDGDLLIQVTTEPRDGTLQRLIDAVCRAAMSRSRLQQMGDRLAAVFLPAVILLAAATFGWHAYARGIEQGVLTGLAVLLIACPCALGIATPMALWVVMGRAAQAGVLFRHGDAIQQLARVRAVCFDKTGTLTTGDSDVVEFVVDAECNQEKALDAAGRLAAGSTHGLSRSVRRYVCESRGRDRMGETAVLSLRTLPGRGVQGCVTGIPGPVCLGSPRWMRELGLEVGAGLRDRLEENQAAGRPLACVGWGGRVQGMFAFDEQLREEAAATLQDLRQSQLHITVLTGDHAIRGALLQRTLGLDVASELLPEDKAAAIDHTRRRFGPVAMVGDGLNDAPALVMADVGIALGCGADVSRDAAQVCLLGNDLRQIGWSIRLASQAVRSVRVNLFWAFAYNVLGIAVAAAGYLNPVWAAGAMVASSLLVVSNSLRLAAWTDRHV